MWSDQYSDVQHRHPRLHSGKLGRLRQNSLVFYSVSIIILQCEPHSDHCKALILVTILYRFLLEYIEHALNTAGDIASVRYIAEGII